MTKIMKAKTAKTAKTMMTHPLARIWWRGRVILY